MAQHQVEDLPEEVEVECIESLREEEDYFCGKTYRIPGVLWAKYRESFRPVGWRKEQAEQEERSERARSAAQDAAQDEFERARDHQEFMEVQAEVERARAQRQRADEYRQAADERAKHAEAASAQAPEVKAPDRAPPAQPEIPAATARATKSPGPASVLPRAERLKGNPK